MSGTTGRDLIETARSFLFVPGDRPDRFAKAQASGCDVTILDLEDAVAPHAKVAARGAVAEWARTHPGCMVRINGVGTAWHADDLRALRSTEVPVMLPKAEDRDQVRRVGAELEGTPVVGLVETPRGVIAVESLAESGAITRLALGNVDLASQLGVDPASHAALAHVRGRLVVASAAAGLVGPIDGVTTRLDDERSLESDVRHARELGFAAKLCIHPRQVGVVNAGLAPSAAEIEWARSVVAHAGEGVAVVDGAMVDPPVVARAERILRSAGLTEG